MPCGMAKKKKNVCSVLPIRKRFFLLHWVFVAVQGLSLVAVTGVSSLLVVLRLLIVVASVVVGPRL